MENQPDKIIPTSPILPHIPPQSEIKPHQQSSTKWLLIFLSVLLILGIGIYFFIQPKQKTYNDYSPTPQPILSKTQISDPTANWKTYTNSTYSFLLKYPSDFFIRELSDKTIFITSFDTKNNPLPEGIASDMQISIEKGNTVEKNLTVTSTFEKPTIEDILIDGIPGKKMSGNGAGMVSDKFLIFTYVFKNGSTLSFSYMSGDQKFSKELFNQILSTVTFLE